MRYILIIILALSLTACTPVLQAETIPETVIVTETVTVEKIVTVEDTAKITELQNELDDYKTLISRLNELLSNVYYGYAENANYEANPFTAFSIEYGNKYYLITAGHAAHYKYDGVDSGVYTSFKFKSNFNDNYIYPKLLTYENDFINNRDYAVLYSDKVNSGLDINLKNTTPEYILGNTNDNIFKDFYAYSLIEGESGSPVININGEVIGIATGQFTDIDIVLQVINTIQ